MISPLSPAIFVLLIQLLRTSVTLYPVGSANKTYCDNEKFPLFLFRPLHSLHTRPIPSHALVKPKYGSPIFGKQHAASHYTTSRNDPLHYFCIVETNELTLQSESQRMLHASASFVNEQIVMGPRFWVLRGSIGGTT